MIFDGLCGSFGLGLRRRDVATYPRHDRQRHDLPPPSSGAPRAHAASDREPFLPLLAVADHRHGHARVGCRAPQASCEAAKRKAIRTARRSRAFGGCCSPVWAFIERRPRTQKWSKLTGAARPTTGSSGTCMPDIVSAVSESCWSSTSLLFGVVGLAIFAMQMVWIPFWAAGVINGVGHYLGLSELRNRGHVAQHLPDRHPDRRRGIPQQSSRLLSFREAREQVVGARHRLGLHPAARDLRAREREEGFAANGVQPREEHDRQRYRARDRREPLPRAQALWPPRHRARAARRCGRRARLSAPTARARPQAHDPRRRAVVAWGSEGAGSGSRPLCSAIRSFVPCISSCSSSRRCRTSPRAATAIA